VLSKREVVNFETMIHQLPEASASPKLPPFEAFAFMFSALNAVVESLVSMGVMVPLPCPRSLIMLETRRRTTGKLRRTPLVAAIGGDLALIGTVPAHRSQWIRNAAVSQNSALFQIRARARCSSVGIHPR
jgi:hypothetical protein